MIDGPSGLAAPLARVGRLAVLHGPSVRPDEPAVWLDHPRWSAFALDGPPEHPPVGDSTDGLLLVVRDRLELRQVVGACRGWSSSAWLGCVLLDSEQAPLTAGQPHWPGIRSLTAQAGPPSYVVAELDGPLDLGTFVADLARRCLPRHLMSEGWPVLGFEQTSPQLWTSGDPTSVVGHPDQVHDVQGDYPPDIVVVEGTDLDASRTGHEHHVLGPLSGVLGLPAPLAWADYHREGDAADAILAARGALALGPVDAQLLNPQGFRRRVSGPLSPLTEDPEHAHLLRVDTADSTAVLDARAGLREAQVARLRGLRGVHLTWAGAPGPREYCRVVVGLAMSGIPLTCTTVPGWARVLLRPALTEALEAAPDLHDALDREVHSIRLRRAAFAQHSGSAWRSRVAVETGSAPPRTPRVSILLPTRRPDQLGFALQQVGRQRGAELELVLATHGHEPDRRLLAELHRTSTVTVTWVVSPAEEPFGAMLNRAADRATGDVLLKMDDDDWYGPDFVTDLLMAREQSGADVVGTPPEFAYVEPLDVTVRRKDATECFRPVVAGGTMMVSRDAFTAVGGFRPMRRYVDAGLLQGILAAGGSVYRTHGHGYLLRRGSSGHTWDPGLGYFVSRSRVGEQWRGFRPSPLLEADPGLVPTRTPKENR